MENKGLLVGFAGVVLVAIAELLLVSKQAAPSVTVTMPNGSSQPVIVQSAAGGQQSEQRYGGTTNLDSLSLSGSLSVSGSSTFTDITMDSGVFSALTGAASSTMSSSATTTACSIFNSSSRTRVVVGLGVIDRGSATSLGSVAWVAGTSTVPTGSAVTSNIVNGTITRQNGLDVITTTSSAQTATMPWASGTYLKFISNTTTNVGKCWAIFQ